MIKKIEGKQATYKSPNIVRHQASVTRARRERLNGHRGVLLWTTGLSGAGKSTISHEVEERLHQWGYRTFVLDGDNVRHGLCGDLGFSVEDRTENIRRIGEICKLFIQSGIIILAAFISPFESDRQRVRDLVGDEDFLEIYCRCTIEVCERRDVKGHYRRARRGEIPEFTGLTSPYQEPRTPDLILDTGKLSLDESVREVLSLLMKRGIVGASELRNSKIGESVHKQTL